MRWWIADFLFGFWVARRDEEEMSNEDVSGGGSCGLCMEANGYFCLFCDCDCVNALAHRAANGLIGARMTRGRVARRDKEEMSKEDGFGEEKCGLCEA